MNKEQFKENLAKDIAYAFWAFAPEGAEHQRSSYMRKLIYPAKRNLIDYAGVEDPESLKQASFTTPLQVLNESVTTTISSFYGELKSSVSLDAGNERYAAMQTRVKESLDQSEKRLTASLKQQLPRGATTTTGMSRILPTIFRIVDQETRRLDKLFQAEHRHLLTDMILSDCMELGYEKYRVLAKESSCDKCKSFTESIFLIKDAIPGETISPFHHNCECLMAILKPDESVAFVVDEHWIGWWLDEEETKHTNTSKKKPRNLWLNILAFIGGYLKEGMDAFDSYQHITGQKTDFKKSWEFYSSATKLAQLLLSSNLSMKDFLHLLGDNVTENLVGDLLYLKENAHLFSHFSEQTPAQAYELGKRTRGAIIELEMIGFTVYSLGRSITEFSAAKSGGARTLTGDVANLGDDVVGKIDRNWFFPDGTPKWPKNNGFENVPSNTTLKPGTRIDRYGSEMGKFAAPEGTSYGARSLPPGTENAPYHLYEVIKPLDVTIGKTAPWFGQPGGGIQYQFTQSIEELIQSEYLRRLP